jgi:hypothetical protein
MAAAAPVKNASLCRASSLTTSWVSELASPLAIEIAPADAIVEDIAP